MKLVLDLPIELAQKLRSMSQAEHVSPEQIALTALAAWCRLGKPVVHNRQPAKVLDSLAEELLALWMQIRVQSVTAIITPAEEQKGSLQQIMSLIMQETGAIMSVKEVHLRCVQASHREIGYSSITQTLHRLVVKGNVMKTSFGHYQWRVE